jgi:Kelch motif protein
MGARVDISRGARGSLDGMRKRAFPPVGLTVFFAVILFGVTNVATAAAPNSWMTVAPMHAYRFAPAAATGPDGRIFVTGGSDSPSTEGYDPTTNTWATLAPMPTFRFALAAATGPDGRIFAIGGNATSRLNTVEAYDFVTNTWTTMAPMPTARDSLAAATGPDGRIYAIGGSTDAGALDIVEAYDPAANTWTTVAPMHATRNGLAAVTGLDGRIYAIGGSGNSTTSLEAYDPATNTWTTMASMPTARDYLAAATGPDGRIYAIGGYAGRYLNVVEAYSPATNTWTDVAPMPTARAYLAATTGLDGTIYAMSGYTGSGYVNTVEAYRASPLAIAVDLTAFPGSVPAPGGPGPGTVTYFMSLINDSGEQVTVTSLVDDTFGNLNGQGSCATGAVLAAGATYSCSYQGTVSGPAGTNVTNTVTGNAKNAGNIVGTDTGSTTVSIVAPTAKVSSQFTTCQQFRDGTAKDLNQVRYAVQNGKVATVSGQLFYYSKVTAPSANFTINIVQSRDNLAFKLFAVQPAQSGFYNTQCQKSPKGSFTYSADGSNTKVAVTAAVPGNVFYVAIMYNPFTVVGTPVSQPYPSVHYAFQTHINNMLVQSSREAVTLAPQ